MTYDCEICNGVNHVSRFHCEYCGTIPSRYSFTRKPLKLGDDSNLSVEVFVAFGAERQTAKRTIKRTARTVPLDYYAEV